MEKIKFPFKPNERVKAAFRQESQLRQAIKLMTKALAEVASDIGEPFEVLLEEHPEFREYRMSGLRYNHLLNEIDIGKTLRA